MYRSLIITFLTLITINTNSKVNTYNIEMLFFKQKPSVIKQNYNHHKIHKLPYLNPKNTDAFLIESYYDKDSIKTNKYSELNKYINWLEKNDYKMINYSNTHTKDIEINSKLFFTNQESIIESIEFDSFNQTKYISRGYLDDLLTNGLFIALNFNNTKNSSTYLYIAANYIDINEHNFIIQEKRKINFGEINYFDNYQYGLMIIINMDNSEEN